MNQDIAIYNLTCFGIASYMYIAIGILFVWPSGCILTVYTWTKIIKSMVQIHCHGEFTDPRSPWEINH